MIRPEAMKEKRLLLLLLFVFTATSLISKTAIHMLPSSAKLIFSSRDSLSIKLRKSKPGPKLEKFRLNHKGSTHPAFRVTVKGDLASPYSVQLFLGKNKSHISRRDILFATFLARTVSEESKYLLICQKSSAPWTPFLKSQGSLSSKWSRIYITGEPKQNYAPGQAQFAFTLGYQAQVVEIADIRIYDLGPDADIEKLPFTRITYKGREPDAPWRKEAQKRIEQHRKADLVLRITDKKNQPLKNAGCSVQLKRHAYGFGCYAQDPLLKNNRDGEKYREWFLKMFNQATAPYYWSNETDSWGWVNPRIRKEFLGISQWLSQNQFRIRGHNIIWPAWRWVPEYVRRLKTNPPELKKSLEKRIKNIMAAAKPFNIKEWDMVNEPFACNDIFKILGREILIDWFRKARQTDPDTELFLNEYNILSYNGDHKKQRDNYEDVIQFMIKNKAPLDGIGMQSHFEQELTPIEDLITILDRFSRFKKKIIATEFDINIRDEEAQADYTRDFLTAFFSHPATSGITVWGFWEGCHWKPKSAMIRKDWTIKPNGKVFQDLILNEWTTRESGSTDSKGFFRFRGFPGNYRITVKHNGKEEILEAELSEKEKRLKF